LSELAISHHCDPVSCAERLLLIVSDVDSSDAGLPADSLDLAPHFLPQVSIQVAKGLIEQETRRLDRQCARQCNALLLAAR